MASNALPLRKLFTAEEPDRVRTALHEWDHSRLLHSTATSLELALEGSDEAAQEYVRGYRKLAGCLLADAHLLEPDLVAMDDDGRVLLIDVNGNGARAPIGALETASAEAPFSAWVTHYDLADAIGLDLTSRVRVMLGRQALIVPATGGHELPAFDDETAQQFLQRVRHYLNRPDALSPLRRVREAFGLSKTELGRLFGVKRQAIDHWIEKGVPAERQEKLATLEALVDLLERKLKPDRLPGIARRPADAYGGETMFDLIAADRHRELLDLTRASFDWAAAA
jgi:DNA-binding XRE family transcriptional regulator